MGASKGQSYTALESIHTLLATGASVELIVECVYGRMPYEEIIPTIKDVAKRKGYKLIYNNRVRDKTVADIKRDNKLDRWFDKYDKDRMIDFAAHMIRLNAEEYKRLCKIKYDRTIRVVDRKASEANRLSIRAWFLAYDGARVYCDLNYQALLKEIETDAWEEVMANKRAFKSSKK